MFLFFLFRLGWILEISRCVNGMFWMLLFFKICWFGFRLDFFGGIVEFVWGGLVEILLKG